MQIEKARLDCESQPDKMSMILMGDLEAEGFSKISLQDASSLSSTPFPFPPSPFFQTME